jgi:hypothetical protein
MESHWSICMEVLLTIVAMSMLFHSYPFRSSPKQHVLKTVAKASGDTLDEYLLKTVAKASGDTLDEYLNTTVIGHSNRY